jgi:hypothetical protein
MPKVPPKYGAGMRAVFQVKYGALILPGVIELYRSDSEKHCSKWVDGKCLECQIPFDFSHLQHDLKWDTPITKVTCSDMPDGDINVRADLQITSVGKIASDNTVWATFRLTSREQKHEEGSDARPMPAHHQLNVVGKAINGTAEAYLALVRCSTTAGDTNCSGSGTIIISKR